MNRPKDVGDEVFSKRLIQAMAAFDGVAKIDDIVDQALKMRPWKVERDVFTRDVFFNLKELEQEGRVSSPDGEWWELDPLTKLALQG